MRNNFHIYDFLEFSLEESDSRIWKASFPKSYIENGNEIILTIPFHCLKETIETEIDTSIPPKEFQLIIKDYGGKILRVFLSGEHNAPKDSEMLEIDNSLSNQSLHVREEGKNWLIIDKNEKIRAKIFREMPSTDHWSDLLPAPAQPLQLTLFPDGKQEVRFNSFDQFFPARADSFSLGLIEKNGKIVQSTFSLHAAQNECFVGTGERFKKMDLSGQTLELKNRDGQGVNNRRTYKNIPFYLSSTGYGLFIHSSYHIKLSLADYSTRSVIGLANEPNIDLFFIADDHPEKILHVYKKLTGFPPQIPLWSFGIWMSRMTYFSEEEVKEICHRLRKEKFPCDVIHLDTGWFETDWLCEWRFNEKRFPDPKRFVQDLKKDGFQVSLWQMPYISADAAQYKESVENNYIAQEQVEESQQNSNFSTLDYAGTIDFTNPKATKWYQNDLLKPLLEMGVACIKTDFGEDIHMNAEYHAMEPEELNNLYALLYQKAAFSITKEITGDGIVWARAAWAGCQKYPVHWGGDAAATWDGLAASLKGGLHFGLSGFGYWSHDVPGFHGQPDFMNAIIPDDLYLRWTQFGVFSSHIRYHGTSKREPYHFPRIQDQIRKWWSLRYALIPYIVEQAKQVSTTGFPLLRAMILHHPKDKTCWHIDDQYFFGNNFLVAPIMNEGNKRNIYFPKGEWIDLFTGKKYNGSQWVFDFEATELNMPVFVKEKTEIPLHVQAVKHTGQMNLNQLKKIKITEGFRGIWALIQTETN